MAYSTVILEKSEGIATLTLNRPERLNAFNYTMGDEIIDAFSQVERDNGVRVLIITGAGRAFCAGADIKGMFANIVEEEKRAKAGYDLGCWVEKVCLCIRNMEKPVIAAMHGHVVGVGVTLSLQCDLRIASEETMFLMPFVQLGLIPEFGATYSLPRLIGIAKACELVFTCKGIGAKEAKEMGLLNHVVPDTELKSAAYELAGSIAKGAPQAIKMAKKALYQGLDADLEDQLRHESLAYGYLFQTDDYQEAMDAFLEKRHPIFKGK